MNKMKKILLATATSAILASSLPTLAGVENMFYLKGGLNISMFTKEKKHKSDVAFGGNVGFGYHFMDNVRAEAELNGFFSGPNYKRKGEEGGVKYKSKVESSVMALTGNVYVDLFDAGMFKVYAGPGLGWARTSAKAKITGADGSVERDKSKSTNNLTWRVTLGASTEVAPGYTAELAYRYSDYGKTKPKKGLHLVYR